jgi:hypothetical protein
MTTTSRWSTVLGALSCFGDSRGSGGARDGKILRSLAAFAVSWNTGMLQTGALGYTLKDLCDGLYQLRAKDDATSSSGSEDCDRGLLADRVEAPHCPAFCHY